MHVITIVGARPQFIKAAPVARALAAAGIRETLVHTGQHYDYNMSEVFFAELGIPPPAYMLGIGGTSHADMTGRMMQGIERILQEDRPTMVVVFGDTNSTLAGALAAAKLCIPVAHVEAGLRSFNRRMPEEINRVVTDHLAEILFCPSEVSSHNLGAEGVSRNVYVIGDVMAEAAALAGDIVAGDLPRYLPAAVQRPLQRGYVLLTLHRAENIDDTTRLTEFAHAINRIDRPVLFPIHPRCEKAFSRHRIALRDHVTMLQPQPYLAMAALLREASCVVTDSGGLQKEAYWAKKPCLTLRAETEWVETVAEGWNTLVRDPADLPRLVGTAREGIGEPLAYGDRHAANRIAAVLKTIGQ
jgi:UDP-GlcNAc3NAcA epimerase